MLHVRNTIPSWDHANEEKKVKRKIDSDCCATEIEQNEHVSMNSIWFQIP